MLLVYAGIARALTSYPGIATIWEYPLDVLVLAILCAVLTCAVALLAVIVGRLLKQSQGFNDSLRLTDEKVERLEKLERGAASRHAELAHKTFSIDHIMRIHKEHLHLVSDKTVALRDDVAALQEQASKGFEWPEGTFGWAIQQTENGEVVRCASDPERRKLKTMLGLQLDFIMWATDWELVPVTVTEILDRCERPRAPQNFIASGGDIVFHAGTSGGL